MFCPNCQNPVEPGMRFCGECGCLLPSEPVAVPAEEVIAQPVAEVAAEVVAEPVAEVATEVVAEVTEEPVAEIAQEPVMEVAEEVEEAPAVEAAEPVTTVYCPQCAQVNQVGDRFCMKCGCKLEGVAPSAVAPAAPVQEKAINKEKIEAFAKKSAEKASIFAKKSAEKASVYAKKGAQEAKKLAEDGSEKAKKLPKPVLFAILGAAAVVVIVAAILLCSAVFGGGNDDFALYLKDAEVFYSDFGKKDPAQITSRLADSGDVDEEELAEASYLISSYMALTDGGNRLFFPDKIGDDEGVTLYYRDLGKLKKDAVKIDAEIIRYAVSESGKEIVYLRADGNLYRSDLKDKEKIASDVYDFYASDDLKTVIFRNDDDTLYVQHKGKDKEKIVSDVENLELVSEDLSTVYYTKDGTLYVQEIGKDRVKIDEDVENVINILESGEVYYTVGETKEVCMMDFVEDDMAAADAAMEEPVYPEYPDSPSYWEYDTDEEYDAAWAEYEAAYAEYERLEEEYWDLMDEYYEKEDRDWLREDLKDYTEEFTDYTLCYFDGKESVEVLTGMTDGWVEDYAYKANVVIASACEAGESVKVKLSEIEGAWDVSNRVYEARYGEAKKYLICGANVVEVELEDVYSLAINNDGTYLTYLTDMDEDDVEGELYRVQIKKNALGKAEKLDEDVYYTCFYELKDGRMVYFKDVDEEDNKGDLFIDGVEVDYDVYLYGVQLAEELGGVLYRTDWDEYDECGTLMLLKGKKAEKIADDVHDYYINEAGELVYLYDYSDRHYTGSMYIYNGGKAKKVDEDVIALLPDDSMYDVMHGYWYYW